MYLGNGFDFSYLPCERVFIIVTRVCMQLGLCMGSFLKGLCVGLRVLRALIAPWCTFFYVDLEWLNVCEEVARRLELDVLEGCPCKKT